MLAVRGLRWTVVGVDEKTGEVQLEATLWGFRFKLSLPPDDLVIEPVRQTWALLGI